MILTFKVNSCAPKQRYKSWTQVSISALDSYAIYVHGFS